MDHRAIISGLTLGIELLGVAVLIIGGALSIVVFLKNWTTIGLDDAYHRFRANLGRGILLGLEVLIVADIIGTIAVEPTVENLGVLALIVLIRTFLSFALEVEISGTLPWRRSGSDAPHEPPKGGEQERA
jgi:uncharacterized membrane protein